MTASSYQFVIERVAIAKNLDGLIDDIHADKHLTAAERYELVILLGRKVKQLAADQRHRAASGQPE